MSTGDSPQHDGEKPGKKVRADFRKNRSPRARTRDWTKRFHTDRTLEDQRREERISGKGDLTRRRTIVEAGGGDPAAQPALGVDPACLSGRVVSVHGLLSQVAADHGGVFRCAVRRLLRTLSTDERHVVATGDRVMFRPAGPEEGVIERVEPRHGVLSRTSRGRRHILVTNVDQVIIVGSAAEPTLKPNLIDRFLVTAEQCGIEPVLVINKIDLVDAADLQPLVGVYSQLGYRVLLLSAATGFGVERLRCALAGRQSVVAGQSGVGKSSLLNAIEPDLQLRVSRVSQENQKGRHTTTTATMVPLAMGGYVVDTPGIRQFDLWDVIPAEVAGYFRELRPLVSRCRYPDCTHMHEDDCAVKDAVADDLIDVRRYESYCQIFSGQR